MFGLHFREIIVLTLFALVVGGGSLLIAVVVSFLMTRRSWNVRKPDEVAELREVVEHLREEVERLKKRPDGGSTDIRGT
jgi:hypothetical protein